MTRISGNLSEMVWINEPVDKAKHLQKKKCVFPAGVGPMSFLVSFRGSELMRGNTYVSLKNTNNELKSQYLIKGITNCNEWNKLKCFAALDEVTFRAVSTGVDPYDIFVAGWSLKISDILRRHWCTVEYDWGTGGKTMSTPKKIRCSP